MNYLDKQMYYQDIQIANKKRKLKILDEALESGVLTKERHGQALIWILCLLYTKLEEYKEIKRQSLYIMYNPYIGNEGFYRKTIFEAGEYGSVVIRIIYWKDGLRFGIKSIVSEYDLWWTDLSLRGVFDYHIKKLHIGINKGIDDYMEKNKG